MLFHVCVCGPLARVAQTSWGQSLRESVPCVLMLPCWASEHQPRDKHCLLHLSHGNTKAPRKPPLGVVDSTHPQISLPGFRLALACSATEQGPGGEGQTRPGPAREDGRVTKKQRWHHSESLWSKLAEMGLADLCSPLPGTELSKHEELKMSLATRGGRTG